MTRSKEWYWGHEDAEPVHSSEYQAEKDEVLTTIEFYRDNHLIQKAIKDLDDWLEDVAERKYYRYGRYLLRIWNAGIRGIDILAETAALLLFFHRNKYRLKSDRHFMHVVGNKIIRIVPLEGHTTGPEHYGIGLDVLSHIDKAHIEVCKLIIMGKKSSDKAREAMSKPLEI